MLENRLAKSLVFAVGVLSVVLGIAGVFLPVLPTTPFILFAAWCFLKSSARAHQWIYRQPVFGKALKDWEQHRSISRPTKRIALSTITISAVVMWILVENLWLKGAVTAVLMTVSIFIATRSEGKKP